MKNRGSVIFLFIVLALNSCDYNQQQISTNPFAGLWELTIMEQQDSITGEWSEWRNGMQGYILYDDNEHMALHLTKKGYQNTNLRFPNFIDSISMDALKHLTGSYVYFARYKVFENDSVIEHSRISHSNPGEWSGIVRRKYSFIGDTLLLRPVENRNSGLRLKWIKSE